MHGVSAAEPLPKFVDESPGIRALKEQTVLAGPVPTLTVPVVKVFSALEFEPLNNANVEPMVNDAVAPSKANDAMTCFILFGRKNCCNFIVVFPLFVV